MESPLIDVHTHVGVEIQFWLQGHYPYAQDWPTLVRLGTKHQIGRFVVFPMPSNLSVNLTELKKGNVVKKDALENVPYAFENRRLMVEIENYFPELSAKALPFWMFDPSHEQKAQVAALRALGEEFRCYGLKTQPTFLKSPILDLLSEGECILDFAEEKGLPFTIHSSIHPEDPWSQVKDILTVIEARPGIRFCVAHSCRFDKPSLDRVAELPNAWFDCSAHRIACVLGAQNHPSAAPAATRFASDYRDPKVVLHDLAKAYPTKLMWGSDAPFDSYIDEHLQLRSSYDEEAEALFALDKETVHAIASRNILKFLNIPS
ncbi:MAG: amidohydrolase family protein [Chthoniobacterales bacterium]